MERAEKKKRLHELYRKQKVCVERYNRVSKLKYNNNIDKTLQQIKLLFILHSQVAIIENQKQIIMAIHIPKYKLGATMNPNVMIIDKKASHN